MDHFGTSEAIFGPHFLQRPSLRVWPAQPIVNSLHIGPGELGAPIWIINYLGRPRNIFVYIQKKVSQMFQLRQLKVNCDMALGTVVSRLGSLVQCF